MSFLGKEMSEFTFAGYQAVGTDAAAPYRRGKHIQESRARDHVGSSHSYA